MRVFFQSTKSPLIVPLILSNSRCQMPEAGTIFVIYLSANKRVGSSSDKFQFKQPSLYSTLFQWNYQCDRGVDGTPDRAVAD